MKSQEVEFRTKQRRARQLLEEREKEVVALKEKLQVLQEVDDHSFFLLNGLEVVDYDL